MKKNTHTHTRQKESLRLYIVTDSARGRTSDRGTVGSGWFFFITFFLVFFLFILFRRCRFGSRFRLIFDTINQNLLLFTFTPRARSSLFDRIHYLYLYAPRPSADGVIDFPPLRSVAGCCCAVYSFFINHACLRQ